MTATADIATPGQLLYHADAYIAGFEIGKTQLIARQPTMIHKNDRDMHPVEKISLIEATFCRFEDLAEGEDFTLVHDDRDVLDWPRAVRLVHPAVPFCLGKGKKTAASKWPMKERLNIAKALIKPDSIVAKITRRYE